MQRATLALAALAALMGAGGVALAAAAAHADGGELARIAAQFLILHAAALLGLAAWARLLRPDIVYSRAVLLGAAALALGAILFSADLASRAFAGARLFPMAAPTGGSLMILAWLALAAIFATAALRRAR